MALARRVSPLLPLLLGGSWAATGLAASAEAGVLRPLLELMQPRLETRLGQACVRQLAGADTNLAALVQKPCEAMAKPISRCLVDETDRSGRGFGVLSELLAGRFGDDSAIVVKRCLARQLGLPAGSLEQLPMRELVRRYAERARR